MMRCWNGLGFCKAPTLTARPRAPVEKALAQGRDVVFDIDWQGHRQLREKLPGRCGQRLRLAAEHHGLAVPAGRPRRGPRRGDRASDAGGAR